MSTQTKAFNVLKAFVWDYVTAFLKRHDTQSETKSIQCACGAQDANAMFCVWDLRSRRLAGNKCMLPECCAAHRDMARPDITQIN